MKKRGVFTITRASEARKVYYYSSDGVKRKVVESWNETYSTTPIIGNGVNQTSLNRKDSTDYVGNLVYVNNALKRVLTDNGYIHVDGSSYTYYYFIKDYLGSTRIVTSAAAPTNYLQKTNYYPFGMEHGEGSGSEEQPYKYTGKEFENKHGLNHYDFNARIYDPAVARFMTMDPLAEKYYSVSPYAYCLNNPLKYVDPSGMWVEYRDSTDSYRYENGQWLKYQTTGQDAGKYTSYTPEKGSFLEGVLTGLNQLNKNVTGNSILNFFANDENRATIVASEDGNWSNIEDSATGQIYLSPKFQGSPIPTEYGIQTSPFWLDIGHELAHRQDVLTNGAEQANKEWLTQPDNGKIIPQSEKYATHMENYMRADAGLPLRTHYASQTGGGVWEPSRILNPGTRINTFFGTPYSATRQILPPPLPKSKLLTR